MFNLFIPITTYTSFMATHSFRIISKQYEVHLVTYQQDITFTDEDMYNRALEYYNRDLKYRQKLIDAGKKVPKAFQDITPPEKCERYTEEEVWDYAEQLANDTTSDATIIEDIVDSAPPAFRDEDGVSEWLLEQRTVTPIPGTPEYTMWALKHSEE